MTLITPVGLMCFPHVFTPRPAFRGGEPRFSCALLFKKEQLGTPEYLALKQAVAAAIDEEWGQGKSRDKKFLDRVRMPWRKCEDRDRDGYRDMPGGMYIQPWSKQRPQVVDHDLQPILVAADVWSGQTARAEVKAFAYDNAGNIGVNFGLNHLQIIDTSGPRLDGRRAASDVFGKVAGGGDRAMADAEDEPPF
jgi:hypothetical protein